MTEMVRTYGKGRNIVPMSYFALQRRGVGKVFYHDPINGSSGNSGASCDAPLNTLAAALAKCTAYNSDTVESGPGKSSYYEYLTASLDWNKAYTHLRGLCSPTRIGQRTRITNAAATLTLPHLVDFSADGCEVSNVQIANYGSNAAALGGAIVSGNRNYFNNCHFAGAGHATPAAAAGAFSLKVTGSENTFENCLIGLDTIERSGTDVNGELLFDSGAARNYFKNCTIYSMVAAANVGHKVLVKFADTTAADRFTIFDNCLFYCFVTNWGAPLTGAFSIPAGTQTFDVLLHNCSAHRVTDWSAINRSNISVMGVSPTAASAGIAVTATT